MPPDDPADPPGARAADRGADAAPTDEPRLAALLDTLLPGDGKHWPAAGRHGLAARTREMAALAPTDATVAKESADTGLDRVLAALPPGFPDQPPIDREAVLRQIEADLPAAFDAVVTAAYNAYYTDPAIRDIIEHLTGYENRPPQPLGYELPAFDTTLLDPVRARGPIWRPVGDG